MREKEKRERESEREARDSTNEERKAKGRPAVRTERQAPFCKIRVAA